MNDNLKRQLNELAREPNPLFRQDFLLTWEHDLKAFESVLRTAEILKSMHQQKLSAKMFDSGLAISIFRDKSTRTRFSFASAADYLGLSVQDVDEQKTQISHGETVRETANMISFLAEVIGIRDDMYLGEGDRYQREVQQAVRYGYQNGILHQQPTIINLQSDLDHPTQTLADLAKLRDYFGSLEALRGKKLAMTWAYSPSYGKPLSVPQGIIALMTRLGMEVTLAYPEGYDLLPDIVDQSKQSAQKSGGQFQVVHDMEEAFQNADVVYPKSWASFRVMEQRRDMLHAGNQEGLKQLEADCLAENARQVHWECNRAMMDATRDGQALYMHCLPADITGVNCQNGEVSTEVFDQYMPHTYHQAGFKPFVIAAMMVLSKIENPGKRLKKRCE
ncbi:MAG: knotted carbamoyltransferase YgeW [Caldithrix sp.]|nr:knotted carbamoyltransferase YgeW [Caldithrix sp.]